MTQDLEPKAPAYIEVATLMLSGLSRHKIGEELGLNWRQVQKIMDSPECKRALRELQDAAMESARAVVVGRISKLADKVVDVIESHLEKNNLNAVPIAVKLMGLDEVKPAEAAKDTSITIVMPTAKQPVDITPKGDV
jgi:hypothetical protein